MSTHARHNKEKKPQNRQEQRKVSEEIVSLVDSYVHTEIQALLTELAANNYNVLYSFTFTK